MNTLDQKYLDFFRDLNTRLQQDKSYKDAACWNWALFGGVKEVPPVAMLFSYMDRGEIGATSRREAEEDIAANSKKRWESLKPKKPLRVELDRIRADYDGGADNTTNRNAIRDRVFELCLKVAGFTISTTATPYRIGMFEPTDVVMFDHWWLEISGSTVETVTSQKLYANSDVYLAPAFNLARDRTAGADTSGLGAARAARVHARYVTKLHTKQLDALKKFAK
jgi:hypothetical protein